MNIIKKIIPDYAIFPLVICLILNCLVYFGNRLITADRIHYNLTISLDDRIPFFTPMIIIYILSYIFWIVGYIVIARESQEVCYRILLGEQIAKLICLFFFLFLPTTMVRPDVIGTGIFDQLTMFIYRNDAADNLFPSIHCLESWICFRGSLSCKKVGRVYCIVMLLCAIAVFLSTVMVKQHVIVDIIGGVAVAEIGLYLSRKICLDKIFRIINKS